MYSFNQQVLLSSTKTKQNVSELCFEQSCTGGFLYFDHPVRTVLATTRLIMIIMMMAKHDRTNKSDEQHHCDQQQWRNKLPWVNHPTDSGPCHDSTNSISGSSKNINFSLNHPDRDDTKKDMVALYGKDENCNDQDNEDDDVCRPNYFVNVGNSENGYNSK